MHESLAHDYEGYVPHWCITFRRENVQTVYENSLLWYKCKMIELWSSKPEQCASVWYIQYCTVALSIGNNGLVSIYVCKRFKYIIVD